ncbi:universal stress protein [Youhaiella tibetensis]|jgi:nucleotide-binding universal stress UspA family protein|uniref:Universal stress protein n=1 Tax=Paradevosia tibetensis TaxID=1447062 RepID=A0A5B9DPW4_9HYPH|nr:universal stress protein [Youhaiella tibetensis]QEE21116.1 universal stress protein [Youhaiella tibetensis]GGF17879.1 universal stress protein [Youhaiella tibetensis]
MYTHILIATDGSDLSAKGVDQGVRLAKKLGAAVTIVTVTEPWVSIGTDATFGWGGYSNPLDEYEKASDASAKAILTKASEAAAALGVEAKTIHIPNQYPADAIVTAAQENGADLIVVASHGRRGLGRLLLGSQATQVLTQSSIPVLVVK